MLTAPLPDENVIALWLLPDAPSLDEIPEGCWAENGRFVECWFILTTRETAANKKWIVHDCFRAH